MTAFISHKLQEAVFALLSADTTLGLRVTGVYDQPPKNAQYPYVSMGDTAIQTADLKDRAGTRVSFDIVVWSKESSQMETKELMADVDTVLHQSSPQVSGFDLLNIRLLSANVVRQYSDIGGLYRGRLNYSALVYGLA